MNTLGLEVKGEVPFGRFMDRALFGPTGYYTRSAAIGGKGADFYTAAQSPLFAQTLAYALRDQWDSWGRPAELQVVEYGGGQGELAAVLGPALARIVTATHLTYTLVDRSPHLQGVQKRAVRDSSSQVTNLCYRFGEPLVSVPTFVVANEVLDALPVERVRRTEGSWQQGYVKWDPRSGFQLVWKTAEREIASLADLFLPIPVRTEGEVCPGLEQFFQQLTASGPPVFAWLIDYGISREEWASGIRPQGTIRGYCRHQVTDVFENVGEQDLTADVNWDHVRTAAEGVGFRFGFLESQGSFLISHGIMDAYQERLSELESQGGASIKHRLTLSGQLKQLVMPGGMGERFQVFGCEWPGTSGK